MDELDAVSPWVLGGSGRQEIPWSSGYVLELPLRAQARFGALVNNPSCNGVCRRRQTRAVFSNTMLEGDRSNGRNAGQIAAIRAK
jgi:hypothetical protein